MFTPAARPHRIFGGVQTLFAKHTAGERTYSLKMNFRIVSSELPLRLIVKDASIKRMPPKNIH